MPDHIRMILKHAFIGFGISVAFAARHVQDGELRSLLFSGLAAAGGLASHQAGLPFLLVPATVSLVALVSGAAVPLVV